MRILRLDLGLANGTVDFHPFVSVVHGLDDLQTETLIGSLRDLVRGTTSSLSGLVENDGELLELCESDGTTLGPFTTEDVVVNVDVAQLGESNEAGLRAELDQLHRKAECDAVHVEEIRADLDATALVRVQALRHKLAGTAPLTAAELDRNEKRRTLQLAIATEQATERFVYEARSEVSGIVSRWNDYQETKVGAEAHLAPLVRKVRECESAFLRAQEVHAEAVQLAVPLTLTGQDDARVEELAAITFDRRGRRAKKRTEAEEAELDDLLAKVGQPTHAAYAMYRLNPQATSEGAAEVARAQQAVERSEHALQNANDALSTDQISLDLATEIEMLKDEARLHLGPMLPTDLGAGLLALRTESENPQWLESLSAIYEALTDTNAVIDESIEPQELASWAQDWLLDKIQTDQADLDNVDRKGLAQSLEKAEAALDRHVRAMSRIDRLEAVAAESEGVAVELEERLAIAQGRAGLSAEDLLISIEPLAEIVRSEAGGSVPLVLVGEFNTLPGEELGELMAALENLAEGIQLIVVTNRQEASSWASDVGLRRALRSTAASMRI